MPANAFSAVQVRGLKPAAPGSHRPERGPVCLGLVAASVVPASMLRNAMQNASRNMVKTTFEFCEAVGVARTGYPLVVNLIRSEWK